MADKGEALLDAAANGKVDEARRLLDEGANVETTYSGDTPLCEAAVCNQPAVVKLLIERKANLNYQSDVSLFGLVVCVCVCVCVWLRLEPAAHARVWRGASARAARPLGVLV